MIKDSQDAIFSQIIELIKVFQVIAAQISETQ